MVPRRFVADISPVAGRTLAEDLAAARRARLPKCWGDAMCPCVPGPCVHDRVPLEAG